MRPPISSTSLQQNESSRQQLQQQQQQQQNHQQQQHKTQQFQIKSNELALPIQQQQQQQQHQLQQQQQEQQIARKIKLPQYQQHDILVEKHLNSACNNATQPKSITLARNATPATINGTSTTTTTTTTYQPSTQTQYDSIQNCTFERNRLLHFNNDNDDHEATEQVKNQQQKQPQEHTVNDDNGDDEDVDVDASADADDSLVQLVDLSTSPPSPLLLSLPSQRRVEELSLIQQNSTKRSSIISDCQYSTQSSTSSDDFSFNNGLHYQQQQQQQQQQQKKQHQKNYSRGNSFDDAAKHFIINFPGDSFLSHNQNDCVINLPLSETEPLLTNIESTVADKQRSICLNKNSASLIFTRKELPNRTSNRFQAPINNNQTTQLQQKHSSNNLQTRRCHSLRSTYSTTTTTSSSSSSVQSVSVASTENRNRRQTKHLPATYHQQQRRSLQLNYNNNLVTTSSCANHNNNCCSTQNLKGISSGTAALHRHHHLNTTTTTSPLTTTGVNETRTTAAATRKQHAYSWYAPVYSALEEELEQDSRDSSPIRNNLANTKKHLSATHYQHRSSQKNSTTSSDNETVALLETRNQINIQAQSNAQLQQSKSSGTVPGTGTGTGVGSGSGSGNISIGESLPTPHKKGHASAQALTLQLNNISGAGSQTLTNYDTEGPQAGSLGLAGGPLPRRKRLENLEKFFKSLVGLRPSSNNVAGNNTAGSHRSNNSIVESSPNPHAQSLPMPSSPEIRITRTPSDQHVDMLDSERQLLRRSTDKLAQPCHSTQGSTSSLNVVQQKLWNLMRREGSAASLHQDKSQSLVQYSGMRKCETVLALSTRQHNPPYSPVYGGCLSPGCYSPHPTSNACCLNHQSQAPYMGSGIFSATGVEQIRPLNRLRNSMASINGATCSRCSSLLSLAASGSRYSLNATANGFVPTLASVSQQLQPPIPAPGTFHIGGAPPTYHRRYTAGMANNRRFSAGSRRSRSCSTSSRDDAAVAAAAAVNSGTCSPNHFGILTKSQRKISTCSCTDSFSLSCSRKSSAGAQSTTTNSSISPPSNQTTATLNSSLTPTSVSTALVATTTSLSTPTSPTITPTVSSTPIKVKHSPSATDLLSVPISPATSATMPVTSYPTTTTTTTKTGSTNEIFNDSTDGANTATATATLTETETETTEAVAVTPSRTFEKFTCKLCLIDVESVKEATTLIQCGCQFCTECMKAYVEFEISEGAYEISCPDAQCPAQGVMTLPEIANLTTANLMKKHHRYRLNREIELDKSRTWCPRAGCETICHIGGHTISSGDIAPSTSTAASTSPTTSQTSATANELNSQLRCAVICPSCKDEFCSACKKTWHPSMTCEENSRRLVADGQDDIGIPFDNDLIKCCPMCAVPIEKDEGCAQMMCKRCKHVFCWYCLASLDDDFLLRHYDKGPCKNKLGHSRASVVWHRAQVIGIFAGFGILLLVASPLLLLAAPCIICCKCRSCSSKIDEGDAELDEATQLQSF